MQSLGAQEERARSAAAQISALEVEQPESRPRDARKRTVGGATAASPVEEGLPPSSSQQQQLATAETEITGLLGSSGANDDDPVTAATAPRLPRLLIRQITGEQTALHLSLDDTIGALKEALRAEWDIEADAQRLLLANSALAAGGVPLEEDESATLRRCQRSSRR